MDTATVQCRRQLRRASPSDLVRAWARAVHRQVGGWATYWMHRTWEHTGPITWDRWVASLEALATAPVRLTLDREYVTVLALPWTRFPLRLCPPLDVRILYHLVQGDQPPPTLGGTDVAAAAATTPVRLNHATCPFTVRVHSTTYAIRYERFRYNTLLAGYMRRDVWVAAWVRAAQRMFARCDRPRIHPVLGASVRAAAVHATRERTTHPLGRALVAVAARYEGAGDNDDDDDDDRVPQTKRRRYIKAGPLRGTASALPASAVLPP